MKKRLRVLFSIVLSLIISFSSIGSAYAERISERDLAIKKLNKLGLTDEEILTTFPEKDLKAIASSVSISSSQKFFRVDKNNGNVAEVSEAECNKNVKAIKEMEFKEFEKIEKDINTSLNITNSSDIITKNSTASNSSDTQTTSDGYFTSTLYLLDCVTDYLIIYDCKWLTVPFNRGIDAFGILTENMILNSVSECYYFADYINYTTTTTTGTSKYYPSIKRTGKGAAAEIDIFMNTFSTTTLKGIIYTNHRSYLSIRCVNSNTANTYVAAWGEYYHQEAAIQFSPGVSISEASLSFALSFSMNEMLPNPYCRDNR